MLLPHLSAWYFVIVEISKLVVLSTSPGKMEWKEGLTLGSHLVINGQVNFKVGTHEQGVHEGPGTRQIDWL